MSRKRPAAHSDAQFALFVGRMKHKLDGEAGSQFENVVRKLIRVNGRIAGPCANKPMHNEHDDARDRGAAMGASSPPRHNGSANGHLPERPDFEAIEAAARKTVATRTNLLALIGQLVFSWSNNESLLIYVLMILLKTDEPSAAVTFSTLNTTRARLDLVQRLAQINIADRATRAALDSVIEGFAEASRIRNELLHAMYIVDAGGEITHTQLMRVVTKGGRMSFGEQHPLDQERVDGIVRTCADLRRLNRQIWDLLPQLRDAIGRS